MRILYASPIFFSPLPHEPALKHQTCISCRLLQIVGSWGSWGCKSLGSSSSMVSCIWGRDLIFKKNPFYMISCWCVGSFKVWAWHFESNSGVWRGWLFHANLSPLWVALVTDAASGLHMAICICPFVHTGNCICARTCLVILVAIARSASFFVENPGNSALNCWPFINFLMSMPWLNTHRTSWLLADTFRCVFCALFSLKCA